MILPLTDTCTKNAGNRICRLRTMYSPLPQPSQRGFCSSGKCSINWLDPDVWAQFGGSVLPSDAASYPRRMETSVPVPRKFQDIHHTFFEQFFKCVKEITDCSSVI